jgi:hypothetical protein
MKSRNERASQVGDVMWNLQINFRKCSLGLSPHALAKAVPSTTLVAALAFDNSLTTFEAQ